VALGECLAAWWGPGDGSLDAKAGAIVVAETVNLIRAALKQKR
jgi:hypothetical protein